MQKAHGFEPRRKCIEDALDSDPFRWTFGSREIDRATRRRERRYPLLRKCGCSPGYSKDHGGY